MLDRPKARNLLCYRGAVDMETATCGRAAHLQDNPPDSADLYPAGIGAFGYAREDRIVARWREALASMAADA